MTWKDLNLYIIEFAEKTIISSAILVVAILFIIVFHVTCERNKSR